MIGRPNAYNGHETLESWGRAMTGRLDMLLNRLAERPLDRDLSRLDSAVWARIDAARQSDLSGRRALTVQIAAACGALLLGLAISHFAGFSPMPRELSSELVVLSDDAQLAPSVRLEGGI